VDGVSGWWVPAAGVPLTLWLLHRGLLWMESRGWVYYRHAPSPPGAAANALATFETLLNPAAEHVVEYRRSGDLRPVETGEPEPPAPDRETPQRP
jgi:hypothetical protein